MTDVDGVEPKALWTSHRYLRQPVGADRRHPAFGRSAKRILDVSFAVMALLVLAPILLVIAAIIRIFDPGPVFYSHPRVGLYGAKFGCLKFRTMKVDAAAQLAELLASDPAARQEWEATRKLKSDPRITLVGNILRRSSLDELPQLINVLRGEMSLVGPRPVTADELFNYGDDLPVYLGTRPGLTGQWQVSGRNDVSYQTRVAMDLDYCRRWSLALDFVIIAKTLPALFSQRGSY